MAVVAGDGAQIMLLMQNFFHINNQSTADRGWPTLPRPTSPGTPQTLHTNWQPAAYLEELFHRSLVVLPFATGDRTFPKKNYEGKPANETPNTTLHPTHHHTLIAPEAHLFLQHGLSFDRAIRRNVSQCCFLH